MSVTGPGCAACDFTGEVTTADDRRPCDACGGLSQFAPPAERRGVPVTNARGEVVGHAGRGVAPEDDWRPLPSCAEVLAHNARTGGDCYGPWLCVDDLVGDAASDVRVVWLCVAETRAANNPDPRVEDDNGQPLTPAACGATRFRPITRRGGAQPWPEVAR